MILHLVFMRGSSIIRAKIEGRKISMFHEKLGFAPLVIDLDNLDDAAQDKIQSKLGKNYIKTMKELSLLNSPEDMALDLKRDLQRSGWRPFKKEWE